MELLFGHRGLSTGGGGSGLGQGLVIDSVLFYWMQQEQLSECSFVGSPSLFWACKREVPVALSGPWSCGQFHLSSQMGDALEPTVSYGSGVSLASFSSPDPYISPSWEWLTPENCSIFEPVLCMGSLLFLSNRREVTFPAAFRELADVGDLNLFYWKPVMIAAYPPEVNLSLASPEIFQRQPAWFVTGSQLCLCVFCH